MGLHPGLNLRGTESTCSLHVNLEPFGGPEKVTLEGDMLPRIRQIKREDPDKVVIDLRQNGGGDYDHGLRYLVHPPQADKKINRKGHLFVLIGPGTFSAAMSNAAQFRTMTNAALVGKPIGDRPNKQIEQSWKDYKIGYDNALEWILGQALLCAKWCHGGFVNKRKIHRWKATEVRKPQP
jgi:hypothetical protein